MIVAITGMPGSGKSTLSERLAEIIPAERIVAGDVARKLAEIDGETRIALENGKLAPRQKMNDAMMRRIQNDTILDGYPRYMEQLTDLMYGGWKRYLGFIHLVLPQGVAERRLLDRGRSDDTRENIHQRSYTYRRETSPVVEYTIRRFPHRIGFIDANLPPALVLSETMRHIDTWNIYATR